MGSNKLLELLEQPIKSRYTAQLFVQLFAATVDGNQLNAELSG